MPLGGRAQGRPILPGATLFVSAPRQAPRYGCACGLRRTLSLQRFGLHNITLCHGEDQRERKRGRRAGSERVGETRRIAAAIASYDTTTGSMQQPALAVTAFASGHLAWLQAELISYQAQVRPEAVRSP